MTAPAFDWNQFQREEAPQQGSTEQPQSGFNWNQFEKEQPFVEEQPKGLLGHGLDVAKFLVRQQARLPARVAETLISAPRELADVAQSLVPEKAIVGAFDKIGLGQGAQNLIDTTKKYSPAQLFPTSEQTKEFTKNLFGEHLQPKNQFEKIQDEVVSDAAALALPLPGKAIKIARPLVTSLGAQLAKQGVNWFGGTESQQDLAKAGVVFLSSFVRPGETQELGNKLYKSARESRPELASVHTPKTLPGLHAVERQLKKGGTETWKTKLFTKIDEFKDKITGDTIRVDELEAFKPSMNRIINELYAEKNVDKQGIKSAQRYANKLAKVIDGALTDYGKTNPQWESFYRPANEVYGAVAQSKKALNWMVRNYKNLSFPSSAALFGIEKAMGPLGTAATAAAGATGFITGQTITQIAKSPTLRKYYTEVISSSLAQDLPKFLAANKKLESALKAFQ